MEQNESVFISSIRKFLEARQAKKRLQQIVQGNAERRGVKEYLPSPIEGFFDINEPLGNIVVSGGDNSIRERALLAEATCMASHGYPVIVLHCSNRELEQQLDNAFSPYQMCVLLNKQNALYDPFKNLTDSAITNLLLQAGVGNTSIPPNGKYYIEALLMFLRAKGIPPYCKMLFTCPHQKLTSVIDANVASGQIPPSTAQQIKSLIMQGQKYRSTVETFFNMLEYQSSHIMCGKSQLSKRVSLFEAANRGLIVVIDVTTDTNTLLINLLLAEIEMIMSAAIPFCLMVDDFSLSGNEKLASLLRSSSARFWRAISAHDFFAMTGSNDSIFTDITGSASKLFILSHSGMSCSKWAGIVGEYDKEEISQSFASSNRYRTFFDVLPGQDNSKNITISQKREQIIKPEEISRMAPDEVFVIDRIANEVAHVSVV